MKFYHMPMSGNALRVRAVIYQLGLTPDFIEINLLKGEHKTAEYLALNPNGKVPVLDDDGFVLWESRAIMAYLCAIVPGQVLYPEKAGARALVDQWLWWQAMHLGPAMQTPSFERQFKPMFGMGPADEAAVDKALADCARMLPVLESALSGKDYVCDTLSLADFSLASTFPLAAAAGIDLAGHAAVSAWYARMEALPAWDRASEPQRAFVAGKAG